MEHGPLAPRAARILAALSASPLGVLILPRDPLLWRRSRDTDREAGSGPDRADPG